MDEKRRVYLSKFLSKHLRHEPGAIGLQLDTGGWAGVDALLAACARARVPMTRAELDEVVALNDKRRFSFDETGTRIRANQGHSVAVDLGLEALTPPDELFHGTARRFVDVIRRDGLIAMARHHVHLSADTQTAQRVGQRHGKPVVLRVAAREMHRRGYQFFCSDNGVWLCERVPPEFLAECEAQN